jgi:hypothetical protein
VLVVQIPPVTVGVSVVVEPTQTVGVPDTVPADGVGLTVIVTGATDVPQLLLTEYDMTAVPAATPVTAPPRTVAVPVAPLVHVPPVTDGVRTVTALAQTMVVPEIVPANGSVLTLIVTGATAEPQLLLTLYDKVAVPSATPDTTPPETVAVPVLPLVHVPPVILGIRVVVAPAQTVVVPVRVPAIGNGFTVTVSGA